MHLCAAEADGASTVGSGEEAHREDRHVELWRRAHEYLAVAPVGVTQPAHVTLPPGLLRSQRKGDFKVKIIVFSFRFQMNIDIQRTLTSPTPKYTRSRT